MDYTKQVCHSEASCRTVHNFDHRPEIFFDDHEYYPLVIPSRSQSVDGSPYRWRDPEESEFGHRSINDEVDVRREGALPSTKRKMRVPITEFMMIYQT